MKLELLIAAAAFSLLAATASAAPARPPQVLNPAPKAADWAALAKLPDWSGVWLPDERDQNAQVKSNPPPWNPVTAQKVAALEARERAGDPKGLFVNCLPEAMPSWMLISHNAMQFAVTPGLIYMLGESDSNRLRRIYTDGRGHPTTPT